jgi:5-methyltetrahydrofolate--homocysteine methyltransferase
VFLHEAVQRGLDSAIVHASKIVPLSKLDEEALITCTDLIYDRRGKAGLNGTGGADYDPLHRLMAIFEGVSGPIAAQEALSELPLTERLERRIIDGERDGLTGDLDLAMSEGINPLDIINVHLLAGMKIVGDRFGAGEMQLPFVLQSAETMKAAVAHLEPHMDASDTDGKARVVLATVKGDVHDIGKNLVDIILTNNGYDVRNLGIKQPIDAIVSAAQEFRADAIGLSGLLVKSTVVMRNDLDELTRRKLDSFPVLLGGAALTRNYVEIDLRERYAGPLFYCKDAFSGLNVMDQVAARKKGEAMGEMWGREVGERRVASKGKGSDEGDVNEVVAPTVATDVAVPTPPFWGSRVTRGIPLDDIAAYLNHTALFRTQWGFDRDQKAEGQAALRTIMAQAREESLLVPQAVHGYFSCQSDGNDLIVYEGPETDQVAARFNFPRQTRGKRLCIPDFFKSVQSGQRDVIAFHAVTMGKRVSERAGELFAEDAYTDYLFLHGFGVEMAEALAEMWHKRVRTELGIDGDDAAEVRGLFKQGYQGSRYSFGYAACPDLEARKPLFDLLDAGRIGLELSEEFQLVPEQSTDALVVHHPEAKYFNAR